MSDRAAKSALFGIACAVTSCAWVGACTTYDDGLLAGYNSAGAADGGASNPSAGHGGSSTDGGAPDVVGGTSAGGSAGLITGEAGVGADAGAGNASAGNAGTGGSAGIGGSTGGATTGGTGGVISVAGSAGSAAGGSTTGSYELIDDFEDMDALILPAPPRNGPWYVFHDATTAGVESPFTVELLTGANVRTDSTAALHLTAHGFTDWGAGVGADFVNQAGSKVPYDASAYSGIHFYAKVATGTQTVMKLLIPTIYSDAGGGKCSDSVAGKHCSDHLFCSISGLKTTWAGYQCNFSALVQQGTFGGLPQPTLDPKSVYSVQFTWVTKTLPLDIWIDDVAFVRK